MRITDLKRLIYKDLLMVAGHDISKLPYYYTFRYLLFNRSFKFTFWFRICSFLKERQLLLFFFYIISYLFYRHYSNKYCVDIPLSAKFGAGVYFPHIGNVVINGRSVIGENCIIFHGVTIGIKIGGKNEGVPQIGDNCVLGPGSKIIGKCKVGNNCFIGANSVVVKDIMNDSVVAIKAAEIINNRGLISTDRQRKHTSYYYRALGSFF